MKRYTLTLSVLCGLAATASAQIVVAYWAQNDNDLSTGGFGFAVGDFPQASDMGAGLLTLNNFDSSYTNNGVELVYNYIQSFGGTTLSAIGGTDALGSLAPQAGADLGGGDFSNNGMSIDLLASTVGFSGITVGWDQRGTSTGFTSRAFSYSTDGGLNFTPVETDTGALGNSWVAKFYDLSSVPELDENPNVVFRITLDGGTGTLGNNRFDNLQITAAVPEPGTIALIMGGICLAYVLMRRRK